MAIREVMEKPFQLPEECCGANFPEGNALIPLALDDPMSHTPSAQAAPVRPRRTSIPMEF
jgi:hypothetical protein